MACVLKVVAWGMLGWCRARDSWQFRLGVLDCAFARLAPMSLELAEDKISADALPAAVNSCHPWVLQPRDELVRAPPLAIAAVHGRKLEIDPAGRFRLEQMIQQDIAMIDAAYSSLWIVVVANIKSGR